MKVIRVNYLEPTDTQGGRFKITMKGMKSATVIGCKHYDPYGVRSAYDCLCRFVEINSLDWKIEQMAFGRDDKLGFFFCFPESINIMIRECHLNDN